jgi:hypothetical protein
MGARKINASIINGNKTHTLFGNGTQLAQATRTATFNTVNEFTLGGFAQYNGFQIGYMSECILFANDQTSNIGAITTNLNTYYSIY